MGNLLVDLEDLHSEFKKKVADEARKSDGKIVSMRDIIYQLVKIYIENDALNYQNLSKNIIKESKKNKINEVESMNDNKTLDDNDNENKEVLNTQKVRLNRSFKGLSK